MAEEFKGKAVFFGASNSDTVEAGEQYRDEYDVPYELALAPQVWEIFGQPFRPTTIVIGPDGEIAARFDGPVDQEGLRDALNEALS
ncbi:MAG: hypothetical protein H0U53_08750 [Actinobacteria bacterium]|nr:hypothetical protein [Actinomycetota bacterium]